MLFKSELVRLWGSLWNIQGKYPLECAIGAGVPKGIAIGVGSGGVVRASVLVRVAFAEHPPRLKGSQLVKFVLERLLALFVINHIRFGDRAKYVSHYPNRSRYSSHQLSDDWMDS